MPNEMFFHHFDEVAERETRSMTLPDGDEGVPAGTYAFHDSYCTEPGCDCRRVLLHVVNLEVEGIIAVISYGFDRKGVMPGPFIDPMHPRPPYASGLLTLARRLLFSDPEYVARLERHYRMMKQKVEGATSSGPRFTAASPAARAAARKKARKKRQRHG